MQQKISFKGRQFLSHIKWGSFHIVLNPKLLPTSIIRKEGFDFLIAHPLGKFSHCVTFCLNDEK